MTKLNKLESKLLSQAAIFQIVSCIDDAEQAHYTSCAILKQRDITLCHSFTAGGADRIHFQDNMIALRCQR